MRRPIWLRRGNSMIEPRCSGIGKSLTSRVFPIRTTLSARQRFPITPAANSSRTPPWQSRASQRSRCRVAVFVVPDVQCPHPGPCYGHTRLEDTADNFAMCKHVEIVVAPCVTKGRRAFQSEVILFHRDTPANANRTGSPPRSRVLLRKRLRMRGEERFRPCNPPLGHEAKTNVPFVSG